MLGGNTKLVKNTSMLYILTFSNYFFGLVTVPYLTRVLGPTIYGKVGVGQAFSTYIQLLLDFGFILSATAEIAQVRDNIEKVSRIFISVLYCKIILILISFILTYSLCTCIPFFQLDSKLFILFWAYIAVNSLLPDFLYRGLEKMEIITIRTVIVKLIFMIFVFIFIKNKEQYLLVPIFYMLGSLFAVLFILVDIVKSDKLKWIKVSISDVYIEFKRSSLFFISRIAGTVYSALNTVVLGAVLPGSIDLGFYSASEKLLTAGRGAITPITDSLYPHMVNKKDFILAKKIIIIGVLILTVGCTVIGIYAEKVCAIIFGPEYIDAANVLRLMLPLIITSLPNYVIAFPVLTPLGLSKFANFAVIIGALVQAIGIVILFITDNVNVYSVCVLTIFTELVVLSIRFIAAWYGLKRKEGRT